MVQLVKVLAADPANVSSLPKSLFPDLPNAVTF